MRTLLRTIILVFLAALMSGCVGTWYNYDESNSANPQINYGGQYTAKAAASHGVNQ